MRYDELKTDLELNKTDIDEQLERTRFRTEQSLKEIKSDTDNEIANMTTEVRRPFLHKGSCAGCAHNHRVTSESR